MRAPVSDLSQIILSFLQMHSIQMSCALNLDQQGKTTANISNKILSKALRSNPKVCLHRQPHFRCISHKFTKAWQCVSAVQTLIEGITHDWYSNIILGQFVNEWEVVVVKVSASECEATVLSREKNGVIPVNMQQDCSNSVTEKSGNLAVQFTLNNSDLWK